MIPETGTAAALTSHLDGLGEGLLLVDGEWRVVYVNPEGARLIRHVAGGAPLVAGAVLWERVPGLAEGELGRGIRQAADERVSVVREVTAPGGAPLEVRVDPSDHGVAVLLRDAVRPGREAEARPDVPLAAAPSPGLEDTAAQFRTLVESVDDVVFRLDREQRCVMVFGRWLQREGIRPESFLGRTSREIAGINDPDMHEAANRRALAGQSVVYDWTLRSPRGVRHMQTSLAPVRAADGTVTGLIGVGRDITDRVTAEREIQRLNADLRRRIAESEALLDVIPIGIAIARDPECREIIPNPACARLLRVPPGTNISKSAPGRKQPFRVFRDGVEVPPSELPMQRAAATGVPVTGVDEELRFPDGTSIELMAFAAPLFDEDGRTSGAIGAFLDVTERHRRARHQELLAEASRTLAASLDYAATLARVARLAVPRMADYCLVDLADADGRIRRVEFAHADPAKEVRLRDQVEAYPPDPAWVAHPIAEVFRTGEPKLVPAVTPNMIEAMASSAAHLAWLRDLDPGSMMVLPLRAHGRTFGALTFCWAESGRRYGDGDLQLAVELADRAALAVENARLYRAAQAELTERRRAEADLRRWSSIFEHAGWGVAITSADGLRIEAVNPAYARMHGYPADELIGRATTDLYAPSARPALERHLRLAAERGHYVYESVHLRADGTEFPVLVDVTVVRDEEGRPLYRAANIQDLTERRRAEEQLRQAQKMEAVGRLAGGVAHDFNNMLMIIIGFSDFLLGSLPPEDPRRGDAEEIRRAAERAATLTRQLLAFGHRQVLSPTIVDLNDVVVGLERMIRPILGEAIRLVIRLAPRLGGVLADRGQLEQVLTNLVLNARDAMPDGGLLELETSEREFVEGEAYREVGIDLAPGPYVLLSVSDSGEGMDAVVRDRLFEPFFTTKPPGQNTGLGLATVYGIVTQSGGSIWVDSEPGRGSRFTVCLPRASGEPVADATARDEAPQGGDETVLVVEDEVAVRGLACRVLVEHGYRVIAAANGREGLEALAQPGVAVDLVLTDVVMPEMGGAELAERIRATWPGVPVLFMSGYSESARRAASMPLLEKPFSPDRLAREVRRALDAASSAPPSPAAGT